MSDTMDKPETRKAVEWLPVIFGNGEDDDTPGFCAVFMDEKVLIADDVCERGETAVIEGLRLVIDRRIDIVHPSGKVSTFGTYWPEETAIRLKEPETRRHIFITNGHIYLRGRFYEVTE